MGSTTSPRFASIAQAGAHASPDGQHVQQSVLLAKGFDSAHRIARYGRRDFVDQIGSNPRIGREAAGTIHARAEHSAAMALHLLMRHHDAGLQCRWSRPQSWPPARVAARRFGHDRYPGLNHRFSDL